MIAKVWRRRGLMAVVLVGLMTPGCVGPAAHGPMGCCGPQGTHGGGLIRFHTAGHHGAGHHGAGHHDSCDGCGERYVDEWINHPPLCNDPCDHQSFASDHPSRPWLRGFPSLWGYRCDPPPTECDSPLCRLGGRRPLCQPECGCGGATCGFETVPTSHHGCNSCQSPTSTVPHLMPPQGPYMQVPRSVPSGPVTSHRNSTEHGSSVLQPSAKPPAKTNGNSARDKAGPGVPTPIPADGDEARMHRPARPVTQPVAHRGPRPAASQPAGVTQPRIVRAAPTVHSQPPRPVQPASQVFRPR
jgi:hypothetical protein